MPVKINEEDKSLFLLLIYSCRVSRREGAYRERESERMVFAASQLLTDSHPNPTRLPPHAQCRNPIREENLECLFGNLHSFIIFLSLSLCLGVDKSPRTLEG